MTNLPSPHGGALKPLLVEDHKHKDCLKEAEGLFKINLGSKEISDLIMLAMGAFSPLEGFLHEDAYHRVLEEMKLPDDVLWPIPINLPVTRDEAGQVKEGQRVALVDNTNDEIMAVMTVQGKYSYDKKKEAHFVFGTTDEKHPGVKKLYEQGEIYLAGPVVALGEGGYPQRFSAFARPKETRDIFASKGWETVAAFQTRNPMHRSHEYLTKIALEICDGLFIHPIVGQLKEGDIPAEVRMKCYQELLNNYYPKENVVLKVYPMEMRYAGPKEAILHAIIRQNFGCSHMILGRDHAGVGDYYGPFDAQHIFDRLPPGSLQIEPLKFDIAFWCYKCSSMASPRTCPHHEDEHLVISGTQLREMLSRGEKPEERFSRHEVLDILVEYYKNK